MLSNELDYQCLLRKKSAVVNLITVWLDSKTKLITSKQGQALCVLTVVVVVVGSRYKGHFTGYIGKGKTTTYLSKLNVQHDILVISVLLVWE